MYKSITEYRVWWHLQMCITWWLHSLHVAYIVDSLILINVQNCVLFFFLLFISNGCSNHMVSPRKHCISPAIREQATDITHHILINLHSSLMWHTNMDDSLPFFSVTNGRPFKTLKLSIIYHQWREKTNLNRNERKIPNVVQCSMFIRFRLSHRDTVEIKMN